MIMDISQKKDFKYFNLKYMGILNIYKSFLQSVKKSKLIIKKNKIFKFKSAYLNKKNFINKIFSNDLLKYNSYDEHFFRLLFACSLGASGYHKRSSYDVKYFRILVYAFRFNKRQLLHKFFVLRSQREGYVTYRENMQKFFIISLFLLNLCNSEEAFNEDVNSSISDKGLQNFFGHKLAHFLETNLVFRILRPVVSIFRFRLNTITKYIINQTYQMNFFLITNNEMNATFLSRYIAKKLHYMKN